MKQMDRTGMANRSADDRGLFPVTVATLPPTWNLGFNLYLPPEPGSKPRLYCERNYPLRAENLVQLQESGVRTLYVSAAEHSCYKRHLRDNLDACLQNERVAPLDRYQVLQQAGRDLLIESFQQADTDEKVRGASELGARITGLLCGRNLVLFDLFRVSQHDFDTFSHVINVSTYCLMLAERLGIRDEQQLERIAIGALLHDIGKLKVPAAILNKPGPLTPHERKIVQQHPQEGFVELSSRKDLNWGQLMMVYRHHERLDGGGYPVGVAGRDLHEWARLCSVLDVFDAMTCLRPYRRAIPVADVLDSLLGQARRGLDKEMVQCWTAAMRVEP